MVNDPSFLSYQQAFWQRQFYTVSSLMTSAKMRPRLRVLRTPVHCLNPEL
jgi:hypothetical protein